MRIGLIVFCSLLLIGSGFISWKLFTEVDKTIDLNQYQFPHPDEVVIIPDAGAFVSAMNAQNDSARFWPQSDFYNIILKTAQSLNTDDSQETDFQIRASLADQSSQVFITGKGIEDIKTGELLHEILGGTWKAQHSGNWESEGIKYTAVHQADLMVLGNTNSFNRKTPPAKEDLAELERMINGNSSKSDVIVFSKHAGKWSSVDLIFMPNSIMIFGFIPKVEESSPRKISLNDQLIPKGYSSIKLKSSGNLAKMMSIAAEKEDSAGTLADRNIFITEFEESCECNFIAALSSFSSKEIQILNDREGVKIITFKNLHDKNETSWLKLMDQEKSINYKGFTIYPFKLNPQLTRMMGSPLEFSADHCLRLEDRMMLAKATDLKSFVDRLLLGSEMLELPSSFVSEELFYSEVEQASFSYSDEAFQWLRSYFPAEIMDMESSTISSAAASLSQSTDSLTYIQLIASTNGSSKQIRKTGENWTIPLHTEIIGKPFLLRNHYTGEKEIFIQDKTNRAYLISSGGKILWEKELDGKIEGRVDQIDIFKNGKLQMAFNTPNSIYCLDRNGNNLDGFPIQLSAKATSPLAVFDYDRKRNYRFCIALEDGDVRNYGTDGKKTSGWNYSKSSSDGAHVEHFKIGSKDYIMNVHVDGSIELLQRNGKSRYETKVKAKEPRFSTITVQKEGRIADSGLLYIDQAGNLRALTFGVADKLLLASPSSEGITFVQNIWGDSSPEIISYQGGELSVASLSDEVSWKSEVPKPAHIPFVYDFGKQDVRIGYSDENGFAHLIPLNGEESERQNFKGEGAFSISDLNRDGQLEMIIGRKGGYLTSYTID